MNAKTESDEVAAISGTGSVGRAAGGGAGMRSGYRGSASAPTTSHDEDHFDTSSLLELAELSKLFGGVRAADKVDLTVRPGELHALVGPNGSGKTTILNMISGNIQPTSGDVFWEGESILGLAPHSRSELGMSRTFQLVQLAPDLTLQENVMLGMYLSTSTGFLQSFLPWVGRAEEAAVHDRAAATIESFNLAAYGGEYPASLPAGIQRLGEVARCLVASPRLLLLDEPAAGLSETEIAEVAETLLSVRDEGTAVLLVEHNMDLVMDISDVVTVIDAGRVISEGDPASVSRDPEVVAAYLGVRRSRQIIGSGHDE